MADKLNSSVPSRGAITALLSVAHGNEIFTVFGVKLNAVEVIQLLKFCLEVSVYIFYL